MTKTVATNSVLLMHYTLHLKDGSVADSSLDADQPMYLHMGQGDISDAFEKALLGLQVGEQKRVHLQPEDAFGEVDSRLVAQLPSNRFDNWDELEEGMLIGFHQGDSQEEMPGVIRKIDEGLVTVDFNHPLAGQEVWFDIQVVDIDPISNHSTSK